MVVVVTRTTNGYISAYGTADTADHEHTDREYAHYNTADKREINALFHWFHHLLIFIILVEHTKSRNKPLTHFTNTPFPFTLIYEVLIQTEATASDWNGAQTADQQQKMLEFHI